jgi:hypothetical protein
VVQINARDLGEHGFGLIVGVDASRAYIVTARHVVARRPPAGLEGIEQVSREIDVGLCDPAVAAAARQSAEIVASFDGASADLALLRIARPAGFTLDVRALAPAETTAVGDAAWLLGREGECGLVPASGVIGGLADAARNLRIDLHGVLGGSSGAPVTTGFGIVGLAKRSDNESVSAHDIGDVLARARALAATPVLLEPARNVPPTDPQAAVVDLTETLNAYLFGARDLQTLLKQELVPNATFAELVTRYSRGVQRFQAARDKYDGTLRSNWPDDVLPAWQALRDRLWKIHMVFFGLNDTATATIQHTQHSPPWVRSQMAALEPDLIALQTGMARFTDDLARRRLDHVKPTQ